MKGPHLPSPHGPPTRAAKLAAAPEEPDEYGNVTTQQMYRATTAVASPVEKRRTGSARNVHFLACCRYSSDDRDAGERSVEFQSRPSPGSPSGRF